MNYRAGRGIQLLRRRTTAHLFALLVLLALGVRTESNFFHSDASSSTHPSFSPPCNACDVEATSVLTAPEPPVLPPVSVVEVKNGVPAEVQPFAPIIFYAQGRAPPVS